MITTLEYAEMANRVYNIGPSATAKSYVLGGFKAGLFEDGMSWGATSTDFKGCVYASTTSQEVVVALQGTKPKKGGDLLADVQILVGMLPQYCSAAYRLFKRTREVYPAHTISITGHSLGGGLAQVLGHWTGAPFVTFNAPGMWGDIQRAKLLMFFLPSGWRSLKATFKGSLFAKWKASTGRNFRNVLDPVSAYGMHYGPVTRFWGSGVHSMSDILERVRASRWANANPLDPALKEWGEL